MTLPGSLATTSTDDGPEDEPGDGLEDGSDDEPEAPSAVDEAEVAPLEPGVDDQLQEASVEPDVDDELWDASVVPSGAELSEPVGLDDIPDEPAESDPQGGGPTLGAALEAILMVVDEPVPEVTLAQVLERPTHEVSTAIRTLAAEYTQAGRGFDLREVAGGWRFYTRADCAALVERFVRDGQQTRLTQAALETLAVVAYRQPVSRARVAAVRGVNSDGVMRTLVARGLVEEAGTDPESQAVLYRTSSYFLERLGLKDIGELPELAPFLPDDVENLEENTK
jgi:segregation and condensation protein B